MEIPQLIVQEAHIYQIPPRKTMKGVRAADWDLAKPMFTGQLKVVSIGDRCVVKIIDKKTNQDFAQCPVDAYPGLAVESVTDSSRYFVLRFDDGKGNQAFMGMGFTERSDSFDFNVALKDHFKQEAAAQVSNEPYVAKHATGALSGPIKINIKKKAPKPGDEEEDSTKKPAASMDMGFFGGLGAPAAAGAAAAPANPFATTPAPAAAAATAVNPFAPAPAAAAPANPFAPAAAANPFAPAPAAAAPAADPFGAFQAAPASGGGSDWVKF